MRRKAKQGEWCGSLVRADCEDERDQCEPTPRPRQAPGARFVKLADNWEAANTSLWNIERLVISACGTDTLCKSLRWPAFACYLAISGILDICRSRRFDFPRFVAPACPKPDRN